MRIFICVVVCLFVVKGVKSLGTCHQGSNCRLPDCLCFNHSYPGRDAKRYPQIVYFGFDDAVTFLNAKHYRLLFSPDRKNPNNCPITMSLYIQHKYTEYKIVKEMYDKGMEIGVHSVTHDNLDTKAKLLDEATNQRLNLHKIAGVPLNEIVGWRSPNLKTAGDDQPGTLQQIGYTYDVSLTFSRSALGDRKPLPYTLDFGNPMKCMIEPCPLPNSPHKGFWEIPINSVIGIKQLYPCPYADACFSRASNEEEAFQYLYQNFADYYEGNREPLGFHMHAAWFETLHNKMGMNRFIKYLVSLPDVYIVTAKQMLDWVRNPVPLSELHTLPSWSCRSPERSPPSTLPPIKINFPANEIMKPVQSVASRNPPRASSQSSNRQNEVYWQSPRSTVIQSGPSRSSPGSSRVSSSRNHMKSMQPLRRMTSRPLTQDRPARPTTQRPSTVHQQELTTTQPLQILRNRQTHVPLQATTIRYNQVRTQSTTTAPLRMTLAPIRSRNPFAPNTQRQGTSNNSYHPRTSITRIAGSASIHNQPSTSAVSSSRINYTRNTGLTANNGRCSQEINCRLPTCLCRTTAPPRGIILEDTPQLVYFAFDGPVDRRMYFEYTKLFASSRTNPDGCPISATLFIGKENNNLTYLQYLVDRGFEVALRGGHTAAYRSLTALETDLDEELSVLKQHLLNAELRGWRSPSTKPIGNGQYSALRTRHLKYDSTLIVEAQRRRDTIPWPYTLDYSWQDSCYSGRGCPTASHPGLWEVPIYTLKDYVNQFNCVYADGCMQNPTTDEETFHFLLNNFNRHYTGNRAPFGINLRHLWFSHQLYRPNKIGLDKFISYLVGRQDVYIVNINQLVDWMKNPTPLSQLTNYQPWVCSPPYTQ